MANSNSVKFSITEISLTNINIIRLIRIFGYEGYGVYIAILQLLSEQPRAAFICDYELVAHTLHTNAKLVRQIVEDFYLFEIRENFDGTLWFSQQQLLERAIKAEELAKKRSKAARARWGKEDSKTSDNDKHKDKGGSKKQGEKAPTLPGMQDKGDKTSDTEKLRDTDRKPIDVKHVIELAQKNPSYLKRWGKKLDLDIPTLKEVMGEFAKYTLSKNNCYYSVGELQTHLENWLSGPGLKVVLKNLSSR